MIFLSTLIALGLLLGWGAGGALQRDAWYKRWVRYLHAQEIYKKVPVVSLLLAIGLPGLLLGLIIFLISYHFSNLWLLVIYVPVLIYSLGRGKLTDEVNHYLTLSARGDTVAASKWVDELRGNAEPDEQNTNVDDWQKLHAQALEVISYRNFERIFGVLFWFFILGAVGALIYRLTVLYVEQLSANKIDNRLARRLLWLLEWPGARVLGLSWALVGNFDSCYRVWKSDANNIALSTMTVLSRSLRGALGMTPAVDVTPDMINPQQPGDIALTPPIINGITTEPDAFGLINASLPIFSRALLLWISMAAVITLGI